VPKDTNTKRSRRRMFARVSVAFLFLLVGGVTGSRNARPEADAVLHARRSDEYKHANPSLCFTAVNTVVDRGGQRPSFN
jgi:hypothetical protein